MEQNVVNNNYNYNYNKYYNMWNIDKLPVYNFTSSCATSIAAGAGYFAAGSSFTHHVGQSLDRIHASFIIMLWILYL